MNTYSSNHNGHEGHKEKYAIGFRIYVLLTVEIIILSANFYHETHQSHGIFEQKTAKLGE
jgi:hypothetical protein